MGGVGGELIVTQDFGQLFEYELVRLLTMNPGHVAWNQRGMLYAEDLPEAGTVRDFERKGLLAADTPHTFANTFLGLITDLW